MTARTPTSAIKQDIDHIKETQVAFKQDIDHIKDDLAVLKTELAVLKTELAATNASISEIVQAWRAAGTLVSFVKFAAALVAACAIIWAAIAHPNFWRNPPLP